MRAVAAPLRRLAAKNHRCLTSVVEQARALLRGVEDPLLGRDVITTDCVSIDQRDDNLRVTLDVRTAALPYAHKIAERCRDALEQLRGVEEITISLQANGFGRSIGRPAGLASVRSAVAVASCKGGVGKSTVSHELARRLSARGHRVGLFDADVHGPSLPSQLPPSVSERRVETGSAGYRVLPFEHGGLKLMSYGWLSRSWNRRPDDEIRIEGARQCLGLLQTTAWGELDYLLIDSPPGTGAIPTALASAAQQL